MPAWYIVLDDDNTGIDTSHRAAAVAGAVRQLDALCTGLGVKKLSGFYSPGGELAGLLDELGGGDKPALPAARLFPADDGLRSVQAVLTHAAELDEAVIADLRAVEAILAHAARQKARWRFAIQP